MTIPAIRISDLRHRYGDREALRGLSLEIAEGEIFALLGPNGSGKTTLFRLLSTLLPVQGTPLPSGTIEVLGHNVTDEPAAVRAALGVVFQSPSLDKKLRVEENLRCYGRLYGLGGKELRGRIDTELTRFGVLDRRRDFVETLSGGLQRRVELAQTMLHRPRVLLLDEPSTGLDPAARSDLWRALSEAQGEGVTVVVTTHLLEEAERADRIGILHQGQLAAIDTPAALQASIGGDAITLRTDKPETLAKRIRDRFDCEVSLIDGALRIESADGSALAPQLYEAFRDQIEELTIGKPTLEDVFIARTGHRFHSEAGTA